MSTELNYIVRPLTSADEPALWEMLYYAIYVAEGDISPEREVVNQPGVAKYVHEWGRTDDRGFIALDAADKQPIGAAWLRLLVGDNRGYGYVDEATPEVSIAVAPEYRGQGIGTRLLTQLLQAAAVDYVTVSLSVAGDNPALRLYQRLGFEPVGKSGTSLTMRKTLRTGGGESV